MLIEEREETKFTERDKIFIIIYLPALLKIFRSKLHQRYVHEVIKKSGSKYGSYIIACYILYIVA